MVLYSCLLLALLVAPDEGVAEDESLAEEVITFEEPFIHPMDGTPVSIVFNDPKLASYELEGEWTDDGMGGLFATGSGPHLVRVFFTESLEGLDVYEMPVLPTTTARLVASTESASTTPAPDDEDIAIEFEQSGLFVEYDWEPVDLGATTVGGTAGKKFPNPDSFIIIFDGDCWKDKGSGKKGRHCDNSTDQCKFMIYTKIGRFKGVSACNEAHGEYEYRDIGGTVHLVPYRFLITGPAIRNP